VKFIPNWKTFGVFCALLGALCAITFVVVEAAAAHYYDGCKKHRCKVHVFTPYVANFLGPVGACESGTGSHSIYDGIRAISRSGQYRGRYQFDFRSWAGAGGSGDPARATATEQAYRAVVWLHRNGRGAWPNC
jgi:hypothetical protein